MKHRWISTTFCEDENCPGHVTTGETDGRVVLTGDPQRPFVVTPDDDSLSEDRSKP